MVRERGHEPDREHGPDAEGEDGTRRAELDPGEQHDREQRCEEEEVSVLDAVGREPRGERGDDERRRGDDRQCRREMRLERRRQPARLEEQHDERDNGDHADVQRHDLDVPEPEAQDLADVVPTLADHAVRAEQIRDRPAAEQLPGKHDDHEADGPADEREEGSKHAGVPAEKREEERGEDGRGDEAERLRARGHRCDEHHARGERSCGGSAAPARERAPRRRGARPGRRGSP